MRAAIGLAAFGLLGLGSGCRHLFRPAVESQCIDGRAGEVQCASYGLLQCQPKDVSTINGPKWLASGCGHFAVCDTVSNEWVCHAVPAPEQQATQALAVATGCAPDTIRPGPSTGPSDTAFGTWRMETCKGPYVCTVADQASCSPAASGPGPTGL